MPYLSSQPKGLGGKRNFIGLMTAKKLAELDRAQHKARQDAAFVAQGGQFFENEPPTLLGGIQDYTRSGLEKLGIGGIMANKVGKTAAGLGQLAGLGAIDKAAYGHPGEALEFAVGGPVLPGVKGLGKKLVKEGVEEAAGLAAPIIHGNNAVFKGKPIWSGVFDPLDGHIIEAHPYERAEKADFHHSFYVSPKAQQKMKEGSGQFFWVEPDGTIQTAWREAEANPKVVNSIRDQLEFPSVSGDETKGLGSVKSPASNTEIPLSSKADLTTNGLAAPKAISGKGLGDHDVDRLVQKAKDQGVDLVVSPSQNRLVINKLVVPKDKRNQGLGSAVMKEITDYADQSGMTLSLDPSVDFGGNKAGLGRFYGRHGFESNLGRSRDFEISEALRREPRAVEPKGLGGIKAYHGSPHSFDQFDINKIGTGEGAQAYGHGLYFAENEGVALDYRDKLSRQVTYKDAPLGTHPMDSDVETAKHSIVSAVSNGEDPRGAIINQAGEWRQAAEGYARHARDMKHPEETRQAATRQAESFNKIAAEIEKFDPADFVKNPGHMYEVNINADPAHFLDWDKPLSGQSGHVQQALGSQIGSPENVVAARNKVFSDFDAGAISKGERNRLLGELEAPLTPDMPGYSIYAKLAGTGESNTAPLKQAGIPGIKYLDQGSRATTPQAISKLTDELLTVQSYAQNAKDPVQQAKFAQQAADVQKRLDAAKAVGEGTRNYVVFDPKIIDIVRKYGIAGALGAGLITQQMADQIRAQGNGGS